MTVVNFIASSRIFSLDHYTIAVLVRMTDSIYMEKKQMAYSNLFPRVNSTSVGKRRLLCQGSAHL